MCRTTRVRERGKESKSRAIWRAGCPIRYASEGLRAASLDFQSYAVDSDRGVSLSLLRDLDGRFGTDYARLFPGTAARARGELGFAPLDLNLGEALLAAPVPVYFHPLRYDQHLRGAERLLDVCLATRRVAQDIEAAIVTFLSQMELHRGLQSAEITAEAQRMRSAVSEQQAARIAGLQQMKLRAVEGLEALSVTDTPHPAVRAALTVLLAAIKRDLAMESGSGAVQEAIEGLTARNLAAVDEHQERLLSRFREHGSGYNLIQRLERLQRAFLEDVLEAFHLLRVADDGLRRVFRLTAEDPQMPRFPAKEELDQGALDTLVAWCRQATEKLRVETAYDVRTTLRISLRQSWDSAGDQRILADEAKFRASMATGVLAFELPEALFSTLGLDRVRLQRFGLAFVCNNESEKRLGSFIARVKLPRQEYLAGPRQEVGAALLGCVPTNDGAPFAQHEDDDILNISPVGKYSLRINMHNARAVNPVGRVAIEDVVLELHVVGRQKPPPAPSPPPRLPPA